MARIKRNRIHALIPYATYYIRCAFDDDVGRPIKRLPLDRTWLGLVHFPRMSTLHKTMEIMSRYLRVGTDVGGFNKMSTLALRASNLDIC